MLGRIYCICNDENQFYIGSTICKLNRRFAEHKADYIFFYRHNGKRSYRSSFKIFDGTNPKIYLIKEIDFNDRKELYKEEDNEIERYKKNTNCVNIKPAFTQKNKYITCQCGSTIKKISVYKHNKTKKHINYFSNYI